MLKRPKFLEAAFLFLSSPFRRQKRRQIRLMMRGYRYLKKEARLYIIEDTVQHLREFQLQIPSNALPGLLWGEAAQFAELIVRQRLSSHYLELTQALLIGNSEANGCVIAPIPKAWRIELKRLGFRVDHFRSSLVWKLHLIKYFCYGIYKALSIVSSFIYPSGSVASVKESYIYFCDLAPSNLPLAAADYSSPCIIGWYSRWAGRRSDITSLRHSVSTSPLHSFGSYKLTYQQLPTPPLTCRIQQLYFILSCIVSLLITLGSFLKGHWWNMLIIHESIISILVRLQSSHLAKEYWFHNSRFYPPLWTYELTSYGSKSIYYFYSTNCEPFLFRKDGSLRFVTPYSITSWSEYLVWDSFQYEFVKRCCGERAKVQIVGPIRFSGKSVSLSRKPRRAIAVFDVQPHRSSMYQALGAASEFYVPDQCIPFLADILSVAKECNAILLLKKKREVGSAAHPLYRRYLESIAASEHVIIVDPVVDAEALAEFSVATISMPFTSTAIICREAGIPSVYYVASETRDVDPSLSHGIKVIFGITPLRNWTRTVI